MGIIQQLWVSFQASGFAATAMGDSTEASGATSTAMILTTVEPFQLLQVYKQQQVVMRQLLWVQRLLQVVLFQRHRRVTTAEDYLSFVIGVHNKTDETPNPDSFLIKIPLCHW